MKLNEETSDFVYLGKRIDKALNYIQNDKTNLLSWFNNYVEVPYQDIMSGELEIEEEDYIFDYLYSLLDDLEEKFNIIFEIKQPKQQKMTNETLRMQMLAGVITEGEYAAIINKEIEEADKTSLNESMIGGIVGIGAINQIPPRVKADYEMAFEYFLNERYEVSEDESGFGGMDPKGHGNVKDDTSLSEDEGEDEGDLGEGNLGHKEIYSIEPEGRFWIVTYTNMDGNQEKVFQSEDEAREFATTLDEGKEVEEPYNY